MREILFRGKRLDTGEWVEGSLHIEYGETTKDGNRAKDYRILGMRGECDYVDPATVGQYTELIDENGKRIFEGDIITSHTGKIFKVEFGQHEDVEGIGESNGWFASGSYGDLSLGEDWGGHEIIGNIHDNPELLEVSEND